jgi:HEAT repeat protein
MATNDAGSGRSGGHLLFRSPPVWLVCVRDLALCTLICMVLLDFENLGIRELAFIASNIALVCVQQFRRAKATAEAKDALSDQTSPPGGNSAVRTLPRFQLRIRHLVVLVAGAAIALGIKRCVDDQFDPAKAPMRGLQALQSSDPATRARGALELSSILTPRNPAQTPEQVATLVDALLVAARDADATVREAAARALVGVAFHAQERSEPVPRAERMAAAMADLLEDTSPPVRWLASLVLVNIYPPWSNTNQQPLPQDPEQLTKALGCALADPDKEVRDRACQVLTAIGRRLDGPPPSAVVHALASPSAATRAKAAEAAAAFPNGAHTFVPKLLWMLGRDESADVRNSCNVALSQMKPTVASLPALAEALHSTERRARFQAARFLAYIGPQAVAVVPDLLPLLNERFEPRNPYERDNALYFDPSVAATAALAKIASGTPMAPRAKAALTKLAQDPGQPQ